MTEPDNREHDDSSDDEAEKQAFKEKLKSINFGRVPGGAR